MKNTFGQAVTLTIFGESHGPAVGVVLDGLLFILWAVVCVIGM